MSETDVDTEVEPQSIWEDTERLFNLSKKLVGIIIGISVVAVALSFGVLYVKQEHTLNVFISAILGWTGYLFAHYAATGTFVHQSKNQHLLPKNTRKILGGIFGIIILTGGLTVWAIAVYRSDLLIILTGAFIFLFGYIIAHYEFTGELL